MAKMKIVILCGGQGSRIRDVSEVLPKPMLSIGDKPMLWHIMKLYAHHGFKDFILCLGYKGWVIKDFFLNYYRKISDITVDLSEKDSVEVHSSNDSLDWKVTLVETGESAMTGARVRKIGKYLKGCDCFAVTYGDGVADVDIASLVEGHKRSGLAGTVVGVHPSSRFGEMETSKNVITEFHEKPNVSSGMINGGFMVFNTGVIDKYFREGEDLILESEVLPDMVKDRSLGIFKHEGFWHCIDTPREYSILNAMWDQGDAPWKTW